MTEHLKDFVWMRQQHQVAKVVDGQERNVREFFGETEKVGLANIVPMMVKGYVQCDPPAEQSEEAL
jgi:hypothetical protein